MGATRVKSTGKIAGFGSTAGSFATLPSAGSSIYVNISATTLGLDWVNGDVTDNQGNTYTLASKSGTTDGTNRSRCGIFYAENIGTPSGTFTITVNPASGSWAGNFSATEYSGMVTSGSLDVAANNRNTSGAPTSGTTATTAQADEVLVAVFIIRQTQTSIGLTSWTEEWEALDFTIDEPGEGDTRIIAATGAQSAAWTVSPGGGVWSACIATFKVAGGGGGTNMPITLVGPGGGFVGERRGWAG